MWLLKQKEDEEVPGVDAEKQHNSNLLCEVAIVVFFLSFFTWMHRFVRGLVSNRTLAAPLMSSPKFHSPVQSQTEMLGQSFSTRGENGRE